MKQLLLSLIIFAMYVSLSCSEFLVTAEMHEMVGDTTLLATPMKDYSGKDCALLKIKSDLLPFDKIDSNQSPRSIVKKDTEVWVYLSPAEKRIYLSKSGFVRMIYDVPLKVESNKVYEMTIGAKKTNANTQYPVSIKMDPIDAVVEVDGTVADVTKSILLTEGVHHLHGRKAGYADFERDFTVTEQNLLYEYQMPLLLNFDIQPKQAILYINDAVQDLSKQVTLPRGTYSIRLVAEGFETLEQQINVREDATNFTIGMKIYTNIIVNPVSAKVTIDKASSIRVTRFPLSLGYHDLKITRGDYNPINQKILVSEQSHDFNFKLSKLQAKGRVGFTMNCYQFNPSTIGTKFQSGLAEMTWYKSNPGKMTFMYGLSFFDMQISNSKWVNATLLKGKTGFAYRSYDNSKTSSFFLSMYFPAIDLFVDAPKNKVEMESAESYVLIKDHFIDENSMGSGYMMEVAGAMQWRLKGVLNVGVSAGAFYRPAHTWYDKDAFNQWAANAGNKPLALSVNETKKFSPFIEGFQPFINIFIKIEGNSALSDD